MNYLSYIKSILAEVLAKIGLSLNITVQPMSFVDFLMLGTPCNMAIEDGHRLVVAPGIEKCFTRPQLAAIVAHEVGHVVNRDQELGRFGKVAELDADTFAGLYGFAEDSISALRSIDNGQFDDPNSDHPSPRVRIANLQQYVKVAS